MSNYFIGIMTGTSADAIDGCIVSFDNGFQFIESASLDFENNYKKDYELAINLGHKLISESEILQKLESDLNEKTINLVKILLDKSGINISDISYIGFSGQTVFHTNKKSYQIGNPSYIATKTKIDVYSDFRNFDIKKGGMGAPLIPQFHHYLFSEPEKNKVVFNIGGIANGTHLKNNEIILASDVGPGNCLMDLVMTEKFNMPFDNKGGEASKGEIDQNFLGMLLTKSDEMNFPRADHKQDYYKLLDNFNSEIPPNNILRTVTEFTAIKIKNFYDYCGKPDEIIVHGGGTRNLFLMDLIEAKTSKVIRTTKDKVPSKYVEAAGFAYLAYLNQGVVFFSK